MSLRRFGLLEQSRGLECGSPGGRCTLYGRQVRSMVDNEPGFPELQAELQQRRSAQTRSRETIESRS